MGRKKMNLNLADKKIRGIMLKRKTLNLVKKVRELTILCDVKASLVIFNPNEAEPVVWPSLEVARGLIDDFYALPESQQKMNEMDLESYWMNKINNIREQIRKTRKGITEHENNLLMLQVHEGRSIDDLNTDEINRLISFLNDKMKHYKRSLDFMQCQCPRRDPPVNPVDVQSEEVRTNTNDVLVVGGGDQDDEERAPRKTDGAAGRISIGDIILRDSQTYYLFDKWVPYCEQLNPHIQQKIGMEMASNNIIPNPRSCLPYQGSYPPYRGSGSNGNPNLEMQPVRPPVMTSRGLVGSDSLWFFQSSEPPNPQIHKQTGKEKASPTPRGYLPYQGSSYNGNPNLEMEPMRPPVSTFHSFFGSVSQPLQNQHSMNNNPMMDVSQPRQYTFDLMNRELGVRGEGSNINRGIPQFRWSSSNTTTTNDGLRQEPPPPPPKVATTTFPIYKNWPGINYRHHF